MEETRGIKVYLDSANIDEMVQEYPVEISGFTTNPTLIKKEADNRSATSIFSYENWVKRIVPILKKKFPDGNISLEVTSDDIEGMIVQGQKLDFWSGGYAYVKVPITTTKGESTKDVVRSLSSQGIKVNVTAVFTFDQVYNIIESFDDLVPAIVSVFAGRIYDAKRDAEWIVKSIRYLLDKWGESNHKIELLWASPRQVYDLSLAEKAGCDIITMTPDLIKKIPLRGKNLNEFSLDTVKMFYNDAQKAGLTI